jgi:hypothetical protein
VGVAAGQVVVDQAHRLHEREDRGGADERPAATLEVLAHGRAGVSGGDTGCRGFEAPHVGGQRAALLAQLPAAAGVVDGGLDLGPVADDAGVLQQTLDSLRVEPSHGVDVEGLEGAPEVLAFAEDGEPAQSRLETFEAELLEQAIVVGDRAAPFEVVVRPVQRIACAPPAASDAVFSHHHVGHGDGS